MVNAVNDTVRLPGSPVSADRDTRARSGRLESRFRLAALWVLVPVLLVGAVAGLSLVASLQASAAAEQLQSERSQFDQLRVHLTDTELEGAAFLATRLAEDRAGMVAASAQTDQALAAISRLSTLPAAYRTLLTQLQQAWAAGRAIRQEVIGQDPAQVPPSAETARLEDALVTESGVASDLAARLSDLARAEIAALSAQRDSLAITSAAAVGAALLVAVLIALSVTRRLAVSIIVPVSRLLRASRRIASGAASRPLARAGIQELDELGEAFNEMAAGLAARDAAVQREQRRLMALVENASDGILVLSVTGDVDFATPTLRAVFIGETRESVGLRELVHPDDMARVHKAWARAIESESGDGAEIEARLKDASGNWRHVWARLTNRLGDPAVAGIVLNLTDVSDRHELEQKLSYQALHDAVTGLPNRRLFLDRLEAAMRQRSDSPMAQSVCYIDLDNFKQVNDRLGHAAGDDFLATVARRLQDCVRPDDVVARLGGDEFAILLHDTGTRPAFAAMQRTQAALAAELTIAGSHVQPRASFGLVTRLSGTASAEAMLADADLAMYFAKRKGKSRVEVFSDAMRTQLLERLELAERLRAAVTDQVLTVQFQPITDLKTGAVAGAEVLARWTDPERGSIPPSVFIPLAEEMGLIDAIDNQVLRLACLQGVRWNAEGLPALRISVNLSPHAVERSDIVETVEQVLTQTGFDPAMLELELTESAALAEGGSGTATLARLKSLGVLLAIDDFGTGYSSLGRLQNLPFNRLKIDKVFIDELRSDENAPLVNSILQMARLLNLEVVAEGVETEAQMAYLRRHDCNFAQGYHFSHPVSADEMRALLTLMAPQPALA